MKTITVLIPSPIQIEALASCAIEGNRWAAQLLETVRRVKAGEPVGARYVAELNAFVEKGREG